MCQGLASGASDVNQNHWPILNIDRSWHVSLVSDQVNIFHFIFQHTQLNDRLSWLFKASTALFPSIYIQNRFHPGMRKAFVRGRLLETFRIAMKIANKEEARLLPVYAYFRHVYEGMPEFYYKFLTKVGTICSMERYCAYLGM